MSLRTIPQAFYSDHEQQKYLAGMITKGGVTEAIIDSINSGAKFGVALQKGITRSKELAERAEVFL